MRRAFALAAALGLAVCCSSGCAARGGGLAAAAERDAAETGMRLPAGFSATVVATVAGARELATLPGGDLLVGTTGKRIALVPDADAPGAPGEARTFVSLSEAPAAGVAFSPAGIVYAATNTTVWTVAYRSGDRTGGDVRAIAHVRTGPVAPHSDGDVHATTSVAATDRTLYVGVGSSCNACIEADETRASVREMNLDGSGEKRLARRVRNPIALAINPATGMLWLGGAGQDGLPYGHPYEFLDAPAKRGAHDVDYGWPDCEENRHPYNGLRLHPTPSCAAVAVPAIAFPAYSTLVGAAFYPANEPGAFAFPQAYRGGVFVTSHGSWHCCPATPPRVWFVPISDDAPRTGVDWNDPTAQLSEFASGFGNAAGASYAGRPTGIAIGKNGSLFIADDVTGHIYRIRHD